MVLHNERSVTMRDESILVCLSASPYNKKVIETACKLASAYNGKLTALYVKTPEDEKLSEESRKLLDQNIRLAEKNGADIATVYGTDINNQIAEYARISQISKIVIGYNNSLHHRFFSRQTLTDSVISAVPGIDVYIVPYAANENAYRNKRHRFVAGIIPSITDILIMLLLMLMTTGVGLLFSYYQFTEANIITIFILGVLLTSLLTKSYLCSIVVSLSSVLIFNYFFTDPKMTLHAYEPGYPITFGVMLTASLITATLASRLKNEAKQSSSAAFRLKILFDTNQLLQTVNNDDEIINKTASQLIKLTNRDLIYYKVKDGALDSGIIFQKDNRSNSEDVFAAEYHVAEKAFETRHHSGASTDVFPEVRGLYLAVYSGGEVFGVVGLLIDNSALDSFEYSVTLSILGECAMAMDNLHNYNEKEKASRKAESEQLRSNLLRSISHDLRTPLTSISGNADSLLNEGSRLDDETKHRIYTDIYDDSIWLIDLVENLLSVTKLSDNDVSLNKMAELLDDVINDALKHCSRKICEHSLKTEFSNEPLVVEMDVKMISQVIVNIVNNAISYTPKGSVICISTKKDGEYAVVTISDNGDGIPDAEKERIFDLFYSGSNRFSDSTRRMGLGLALCQSIITAHNGTITLQDNNPSGCVFTIRIPLYEVTISE